MTTASAFGLELTSTHGTRVLRAMGRLVVGAGADAPVWTTTGAIGDDERVVMDLREVTAIDAGGIGRLLRLRHSVARRGGRVTIGAAGPRVRRVLTLTKLDAVFGIASGATPGDGAASAAVPLWRCA